MKPQTKKDFSWAIGLTVLMIIVGLFKITTPLPQGIIGIELAGVIGLSAMLGLSLRWGVGITAIATVVLMLLGKANWMTAVEFGCDMLAISLLVGWKLPRDLKITHRQFMGAGIVTGIAHWLSAEVICGLLGMSMSGGAGILPVMRLGLPVALMTALLFMLLIPPVAMIIRHFNWQPPQKPAKPEPKSMVIDLSDHQGLPKDKEK